MKSTKDNFSAHADKYAKYRPGYPAGLYDFLLSRVNDREAAWDCGTGNGQVAVALSAYFRKVYATDISAEQIRNAPHRENVYYSVEPAEHTSFDENTFSLVTVAQAIHWFDFDAFYQEARRTMRNNGLLAVMGYGLIATNDKTDVIISDFYQNIVGPFWDAERKYVDEHYMTIPFPFDELQAPEFVNSFQWTLEEFKGYLGTWSAVQHYIKARGYNPVKLIEDRLQAIWPAQTRKNIVFPVLLRVARIQKQP